MITQVCVGPLSRLPKSVLNLSIYLSAGPGDRYITSLASALTANVTREAKRGTSSQSPGNTDTNKQAHIASLQTAVKAQIQRKRINLSICRAII